VSVVVTSVLLTVDDVCLTRTISPFITFPGAVTYVPQFILYSHPETDIFVLVLISEIVTGLEL